MSRLIGTAVVVWVIAALAILSPPSVVKGQVPMTGAGLGAPASSPGGFQGSGDIVSGAIVYWSCARAYTAAYANGAGKACDVERDSDSTSCTIVFNSTGFADVTTAYCNSNTQSVTAFCNGTTCQVRKAYDQSGANDCGAAACDATPVPGADDSLKINLAGLGSKVCISVGGIANLQSAATNSAHSSQPYSASGVGERTGATTSFADLVGTGGGTIQPILWNNAANQISVYAGTVATAQTASDNSYHAFNNVINGNSSVVVVDGSATTGLSSGSNTIAANIGYSFGGGNNVLTGNICEGRLDAIAYSATQYGNLNTNQHSATSGYNF